jgi:hypothetical protein
MAFAIGTACDSTHANYLNSLSLSRAGTAARAIFTTLFKSNEKPQVDRALYGITNDHPHEMGMV